MYKRVSSLNGDYFHANMAYLSTIVTPDLTFTLDKAIYGVMGQFYYSKSIPLYYMYLEISIDV